MAVFVISDSVAPEFQRYVSAERKAKRLAAATPPMSPGEVTEPLFVNPKIASELLTVAAKRAVGLFGPTQRKEAVWVNGDSQLAVSLDRIRLDTGHGLIHVTIPVRCDQTGAVEVEVLFAVGSGEQPAGMFASTHRQPRGPAAIVDTWGEALVAHAWQCVLGMISGVAGAVGRDDRGNVLVPAELVASPDGLRILPMARHRFSGSTALTSKRRPGPR